MAFSKFHSVNVMIIIFLFCAINLHGQILEYNNKQVNIRITETAKSALRITLEPAGGNIEKSSEPELALVDKPEADLFFKSTPKTGRAGTENFIINFKSDPLALSISNKAGRKIQDLVFSENDSVIFSLDDNPILGMGEGGPRMGREWRDEMIEFDRRGRMHRMEPRWQANAYGSRNPVPLLVGTGGWGLFVVSPWVQVDLRDKERGVFIPTRSLGLQVGVQDQGNQQQNSGKGLPPAENYIPGRFDIFVFDISKPEDFMNDLAGITGRAVIPPVWSLGYMQSHRTLEDDKQMIDIVKTFRKKKIPLDAVIYLGTGFCPRGWNTEQPSFDFNPQVFSKKPSEVIDDLHDLDVKVVVHMVPWDRDKLPTLHGNIPAETGESIDESHILNYWKQHIGLVESGIDAWWPDEGDWFNLHERIKRHQLYYQGPLYTETDTRPWSLHRNGYIGIARWGGWVWSGDTESSWKTLEGQIAVGINHSLSLSPFWGSDIGGFYPNEELDGELYARWFQFGAFCPSFRSHGRTWWTRLPWGWGLDEMGPEESRHNPLESELNNPEIEPVCRKYAQLRYRLLSYNYTLAWEARTKGLPMMRAMWLHYPEDKRAIAKGDQYMWGRDILVAPVYEKGALSREVYLPEGNWYDWWTNKKYTGGENITRNVKLSIMPLFVREGAIIPFDPPRQYTGQHVSDPLEIKIYSGSNGKYILYRDDGLSLDYLDNKHTDITEFVWDDESKLLTVRPAGVGSGADDTGMPIKLHLIPGGKTKQVEYRGKLLKVKF
ncbi:MAG: DUF5110 domain-containing protein [Bacteroidales bacterium]|nr:DUF5110 domain-containing protein [Bacteroidales bacterium]